MKITQLIAALQKFAEPREQATEAGLARPDALLDARPDALPAKPVREAAPGNDIVTISPEAVFLFAASQFDPQRITRNEANELADTLRDGSAISPRDHAILSAPVERRSFAGATASPLASPANLTNEFQGQLAYDMAQSNITAVEADTRALAILGRLSSLRDELL